MAHLPRGYEAIAGATTHTVLDEAGGHAVVVGRHDPRRSPSGRTGRWTRRRSSTRSATRTTSTSRSPASSSSRTRTPTPAAGRCRSTYVADGRGDRARARRPAPRRRRPVLQRRRRPRRHAGASSRRRPTRVTFCLSKGLAAPVGSVVVGNGAVHRPRAPRAQAARRRHAPGRGPRRGRPRRPARRPGRGHDRAPRRGPRQRPPARRGPRRASTASARRAGSPSPSDGPLDPGRAVTNFVLFRVDRDRVGLPRRPRGARAC